MPGPAVNGHPPASEFLNHLASYPAVSNSIDIILNSPVGAKSVQLADRGYTTMRPVLSRFSTPLSWMQQYITMADHLGDEGLSRFDQGLEYSRQLAMDGKQYVQESYENSFKRSGGYGARPKALARTCFELWLDSVKLPAQAFVTFVDDRRRASRADLNDGNATEPTVNGRPENESAESESTESTENGPTPNLPQYFPAANGNGQPKKPKGN